MKTKSELYKIWLATSEIPNWLRLLWRAGFLDDELDLLEKIDSDFRSDSFEEKKRHDLFLKGSLPRNQTEAKIIFPEYEGKIIKPSAWVTNFQEKIEQSKAVDIVEIANSYLELKKVGSRYVACCPFHLDKNPSFTIFPEGNNYHCFGCGEHGNTISFLMKIENIPFKQAVKSLANYKLSY